MNDKKTFCEHLYKKYLNLRERTRLKIQDGGRGRTYTWNRIVPNDVIKEKEIRLKLLADCMEELDLSPAERFEIKKE